MNSLSELQWLETELDYQVEMVLLFHCRKMEEVGKKGEFLGSLSVLLNPMVQAHSKSQPPHQGGR